MLIVDICHSAGFISTEYIQMKFAARVWRRTSNRRLSICFECVQCDINLHESHIEILKKYLKTFQSTNNTGTKQLYYKLSYIELCTILIYDKLKNLSRYAQITKVKY